MLNENCSCKKFGGKICIKSSGLPNNDVIFGKNEAYVKIR